jgi:hypothetical protein
LAHLRIKSKRHLTGIWKMFGQRTVLIVGAGASAESGMPTGDELKKRIAEHLNFRHPSIDNEFRALIELRFNNEEQQKYLEAAKELSRHCREVDSSIDDALNWFSDNRDAPKADQALG